MGHEDPENLLLYYNLGHCFCLQKGHSIHQHTFSILFYSQLLTVVLLGAIYLSAYDNLVSTADKQILHYFDNAHHSM